MDKMQNKYKNESVSEKIGWDREILSNFIARLDRLQKRQLKLEYKSYGPFIDDRQMESIEYSPYIQLCSEYLLRTIERNLKMLQESRSKCLNCGKMRTFELDYNRLEKAYYNLKVDVESFVRLQELPPIENT